MEERENFQVGEGEEVVVDAEEMIEEEEGKEEQDPWKAFQELMEAALPIIDAVNNHNKFEMTEEQDEAMAKASKPGELERLIGEI